MLAGKINTAGNPSLTETDASHTQNRGRHRNREGNARFAAGHQLTAVSALRKADVHRRAYGCDDEYQPPRDLSQDRVWCPAALGGDERRAHTRLSVCLGRLVSRGRRRRDNLIVVGNRNRYPRRWPSAAMQITGGSSYMKRFSMILMILASIAATATAAAAQSVDVHYATVSDFGSGFQGMITITNNGSTQISGWRLDFDMSRSITSIFDASIASHVGSRYSVVNASYNGNIAPGMSVTFGFVATPGNVSGSPVSNFSLNNVSLSLTGTTISYQGRLSDGASATGAYDFQFALYDDFGTAIGPVLTVNDLQVSNGIFTTQLDFGSGAFTGGPRLLEIRLRRGAETGAYTTLSPRQAITATPYAIYAQSAAKLDGIAAGNFVQTDDARLSDARPPTAGSSNYIRNSTVPQSADLSITGKADIGSDMHVTGNVTAGSISTAGSVTSGCRTGYTAVSSGRLCVSAMQPASSFWNAVGTCTSQSARVGNSSDVMMTFTLSGFNYFGGLSQGWLADHIGDDIWGTWNVTSPATNFDGTPLTVGGSAVPSLPYRCVY
jgi:Cellulose binding domain